MIYLLIYLVFRYSKANVPSQGRIVYNLKIEDRILSIHESLLYEKISANIIISKNIKE
jgi:hypothetical protein